jgi:UDP-N-acetylglucosamine acyltransferase
LLIDNYQLSIINYQLSIINYQLSIINYQLSIAMTLIHPTAAIDSKAELHPTVHVGAYTVIGPHVKIGPDTQIVAHVVIEGPTEIGARNRIFSGAVIGMEPQDLKYSGAASWVIIGDDNLIREFVTINRATAEGECTVVGNGNLLMSYVHVAHNCAIENSVILSSYVGLAGHVHIESKAVIGGDAGFHQFVHVGQMAMVGGKSRVDRDVPPYMLVEGHQCRVRSLNQVGLKRAGISEADFLLLKKAFRLLYRSHQTYSEAIEKLDLLADNEYLHNLKRFLSASQSPGRRGVLPGKA